MNVFANILYYCLALPFFALAGWFFGDTRSLLFLLCGVLVLLLAMMFKMDAMNQEYINRRSK